jgi:hypothetical protein
MAKNAARTKATLSPKGKYYADAGGGKTEVLTDWEEGFLL